MRHHSVIEILQVVLCPQFTLCLLVYIHSAHLKTVLEEKQSVQLAFCSDFNKIHSTSALLFQIQ